ncbi:MAG: pilin [Elusimicrobia bacterium]|nr:pilin [Elusimicrobiota bacterium]MDY6039825.1 pilin [Elusimicrobiaceae bacterium]
MKKGFTLIELLVVVLIIGILSAVALPQYTKAVEKSRMVQALSLFQPLRQAVDAYVLAAGYGRVELVGKPSSVASAELDIDVEKLANCQSGQDRCVGKDFAYDVWCYTTGCTISICREKSDDTSYCLANVKNSSTSAWSASCDALTDEGYAMCKSLEPQGWELIDDR